MKTFRNAVLVALAASVYGIPTVASANDSFSVSLGLKTWFNKWSSPASSTPSSGTPSFRSIQSSSETDVIPQLTSRYGNWFASGSYLLPLNFHFSDSLSSFSAKRSEWDLNVGYFVLPGLAVSLGKKYVELDYSDPSAKWEMDGFTLGLSASAPIADRVGLYGNFAAGLDSKFDQAANSYDNDYYLVEVGLSYSIPNLAGAKNVSLTGGYRQQIIRLNDPIQPFVGEAKDETRGLSLGLVASF